MIATTDEGYITTDPTASRSSLLVNPEPKSKFTLSKGSGFVFHSPDLAPNIFHRKMQQWLLGIYWEDISK